MMLFPDPAQAAAFVAFALVGLTTWMLGAEPPWEIGMVWLLALAWSVRSFRIEAEAAEDILRIVLRPELNDRT